MSPKTTEIHSVTADPSFAVSLFIDCQCAEAERERERKKGRKRKRKGTGEEGYKHKYNTSEEQNGT